MKLLVKGGNNEYYCFYWYSGVVYGRNLRLHLLVVERLSYKALPTVKQDSVEQNKLMQKAGDIISELVVPDNIESEETEASIELNFAVVKFKYSVKKKYK